MYESTTVPASPDGDAGFLMPQPTVHYTTNGRITVCGLSTDYATWTDEPEQVSSGCQECIAAAAAPLACPGGCGAARCSCAGGQANELRPEHPRLMLKPVYPTLDEYYDADPRRRWSGEADYGVHWRLAGWEYRWRVSYVQATGEVYAVHQGSTIGPVFVLALVEPDVVNEGSTYYDTVDGILDGWAQQCGHPDSLRWVKDRLNVYRPRRI